MTRIDEIIANALAGIPETDVAILAREVVRLREAPAVVVPEYPENDFAIRESIRNAGGDPDFDQCIHRAGWFDLSSRVRAIPADRVLGEGMRQIDARRFARMQAEEAERPYLLELERYVRTMARLQNWSKDTTGHGPLSSLDRLRANQGGAAT